ncbi:MAG: metallophosphoesterase [Rhodoferax sp.]|nr:metallophosphoesterase [Rhodoferax sp.]
MKIQLASDLHLEFLERDWPRERLIECAPDADVLVLAGDIAKGTDALTLFADWPVPVIYLAGNHEFYGQFLDPMRKRMREVAKDCGIHFLDNDSIEIDGVRFLGTTLWTDYQLDRERSQVDSMRYVEQRLNDHFTIRTGKGTFTTQHALAQHHTARAWLQAELNKPFDGKTVVVSHHGPHPLSVHPRYIGNRLNPGFVSDLSDLMPGVDLWLHGHVHDSFDYRVGKCRVMANPAGYMLSRRNLNSIADWQLENAAFDRMCVLDLTDD